jgi:hypothetical protein
MSSSNRVIVRYIPEVTLGVTPTNGTWKTARYTSESLSATPETTTSAEVRSDRMISDMPKVGTSIGGGLDFELSTTTYDDFISAAMCSPWTSNVVKIGTTDYPFSFEKEFADISKFIKFVGMKVDSMSLSMAYGSIITGSFAFLGTGASTPATSSVGTGSTTAATSTPVLNASSDIGSVKIDGVATDICIQSLDISVENSRRQITCIGLDAPKNNVTGTANVTGSVTMYLSANSFALYETALANGSVSLEYTVSKGSASYTFLIPNAKLSAESPQSSGLDSDVMLTASFTALFDDTEGSSLVITRTV